MKKTSWEGVLVVLLNVVLLAGCAGTLSPEVQQTVRKARANFEVVQSLEVQDAFPDDYLYAHDKLVEAEQYLESSRNKNDAKLPAEQSLSASQRILQQFYQGTITPLAKKAKAEIEKITEEDPDNPLKDFLPSLDNLLTYSEQLNRGEEIIALGRVLDDLNEVINIQDNVTRNTKTTLESDVSFDSGKYELSERGKHLLKEFFEDVVLEQQADFDQYMGNTITMKIKVVGYTDQQGFRRGTELIKTLLQGVEQQFQQGSVEERHFLNQRLSQLRADMIGEYIRKIIEQIDPRIFLEEEIVGRGEEVPPGMVVTGSANDKQRRICKIYSYVIIQ